MKKIFFVIVLLSISLFTGCENKEEVKDGMMKESLGMRAVEVIDLLNAPGYTYLQVKEKENTYWIAVPQMEVEKGETLYFSKSMEMKDFRSETIDKTFESVLFVEDITRNPNQQHEQLSNVHSQVGNVVKEDIKIEPVTGGFTIEKIYADKESLSGKIIKVKGKVVKFNKQIMNRNWIHLQDGTGTQGNFDLMVTSNEDVMVGQIVTVEGKVAVNKDFGSGYSYVVLLEDSKIKVE